MIPSILAKQIRQGLEDFLNTTFPITTTFFKGILQELLNEEGEVFKGPYLRLSLPFKTSGAKENLFSHIPLPFQPYLHQQKAFERLTGEHQKSTIVATGTGSGKTESFLFPILEWCYKHRREPGIKAILIYPMNALATDQAARIAKAIHNNPDLRGNVRAGIYIGQLDKNASKVMGPDTIISNKETIKLSPPDILLTNYKMLDYLLLRPEDAGLWSQNRPETLKFLVVDELHTFDGAQGTDLACLLRRLKFRLKSPEGHLCCIGTSATLGSEEECASIIKYAATVFGEKFDADSIIQEERVDAKEFLRGVDLNFISAPGPDQSNLLDPEEYNSPEEYISQQVKLWFGLEESKQIFSDNKRWQTALGNSLKGHLFFQALLKVIKKEVASFSDILAEFKRLLPDTHLLEERYVENLLASLLALLSAAKGKNNGSGTIPPFLLVRLEFWMRELRRMVCKVSTSPRLRFADDLPEEELKTYLPFIHCRECGAAGWSALARKGDLKINPDLQAFYAAFFSEHPDVIFLFPSKDFPLHKGLKGMIGQICQFCLNICAGDSKNSCPSCGRGGLINVFIPDSTKELVIAGRKKRISSHDCPFCQSKESLTILGARAASLASVEIAQLFASRFNDHKKLITFSDSVQDAAHRAGFFTARTWRFNLRTAIQKVVKHYGAAIRLSEFPEIFFNFWQKRLKEDERFISTFIAPNMLWFRDFEEMKRLGSIPQGSKLKEDIKKRIGWEIFSEYCFSARIGRTLEKTGASAARPDFGLINQVVPLLTEMLRNEMGELKRVEEIHVARLVHGMLLQMKNRGAVYHEILKSYIEAGGKVYLLSQRHIKWMPNFGPSTRAPAFVASVAGNERMDLLSKVSGQRPTWFQDWADKCISEIYPLAIPLTDQLLHIVMPQLVKAGILAERKIKGKNPYIVWGIKPEALLVNEDVARLRCSSCGHLNPVAEEFIHVWRRAPCMRFGCPGRYEHLDTERDYYSRLYTKGDVARVYAEEHTGLLDRAKREKVEQEFKEEEQRRPWYPNLLSCTPTLELGIDIGDLSSVLLCSVPPAQANYLQRVGRAGRKDGNALNMTLANATNHDLYFFADPEEMIAGRVEPPGIFLKASAVLERQLTAFCFDRWIESGISEADIPRKLGTVLNSIINEDNRKFPFNFLNFIKMNGQRIFDDFVKVFSKDIGVEAASHLKRFMFSTEGAHGHLGNRIIEGLFRCRQERDSLKRKVQALNRRLKKKQAAKAIDKKHEEELTQIRQEKNALQALIKSIDQKNVFNFFTDEGLIPNYAFPESGVLLKSVIYRKKENIDSGTKGGYESWSYEYERPASSALSELAPGNIFFAGGRKVKIDQIDVTLSEPETWRFCNSCSFAQLEAKVEAVRACPRCGSPIWADQGQKRDMIRMRQVFATSPDRESRISDDAEDRPPLFYVRHMLVDVDKNNIKDSWAISDEDLPFGFEFLLKASFKEINFGQMDTREESVTIAGREFPATGFVICRHCGKIQSRSGKAKHALTCKARKPDSESNFTDCVYLYREFSSEAIRILIPVVEFWESEKKLHSFIAALQLGLKERFKGDVAHIHVTIHEEPQTKGVRKRYLVLYDSVPGGTGYLKELMRSPEPIIELLESVLNRLKSCPCNSQPFKDGCYRCLYAYRSRYYLQEISRDAAIDLLTSIISRKQKLKQIKSLDNISLNPLMESELEALFIAALEKARFNGQKLYLEKMIINGKPGFFLKIDKQAWHIEPQVSLGKEYGIIPSSIADFVFWPARSSKQVMPIAVFTDGYAYHQDRIGKDIAQRTAIAASGHFHVWSLTWKDVKNNFESQGDFFENFLATGFLKNINLFQTFLERFGISHMKDLEKKDSFSWLLHFLARPEADSWKQFAFIMALMFIDFKQNESMGLPDNISRLFQKIYDQIFCNGKEEPVFCGSFVYPEEEQWIHVCACAETHAGRNLDPDGISIFALIDDRDAKMIETTGFERAWNGFLRLHNLFQFLPKNYFTTLKWETINSDFTTKDKKPSHHAKTPLADMDEQWKELFELTDSKLLKFVEALQQAHVSVPEPGYELVNEHGEVIAEAELGWEDMKIAILQEDSSGDYRRKFQEKNWLVFEFDEALSKPDKIIEILRAKNKETQTP